MKSIREALRGAVEKIGVSPTTIPLELTADFSHGDYASSVALQYAKEVGMAPRALAEKIVAELGVVGGVSQISIAGPGFINFTLDPAFVFKMLEIGRSHGEAWGSGVKEEGRTVMVEYTDPNPFKVFHIGHLMSNAVGESIARLYEYASARVIRANYQGDVGPHVAKAVYMLLQQGVTDPTIEEIAAAYIAGDRAYEENAKEAIDEVNRKIYARDPSVMPIYEKGRALSLEHFEEIYKILGTKFDHYFFESVTGPRGVEIVRAHPEVFVESEGATVFKGEEYGLHTRVFLNKLGLPTYEAKDLGLAEIKKETAEFDVSITITAQEQTEYFKVVLKALELVHPEWTGQFKHLSHGMMRFAEGKMSSRKGNVITGESLLNDLIEVARERASESRAEDPEALAQAVAVAAIKYQVLRGAPSRDIIFDREQALSLEGDSGPYLQYAHARACAVLEKAEAAGVEGMFDNTRPASELARLIFRFHDTVMRAHAAHEPHHVANYLTALAGSFNSWYAQEQILDGTPGAAHKVALTDIVRLTLKNGLYLLGIPAPEKM